MIDIRALAHYRGASPFSSLPILCVEIRGDRAALARLLRCRHRMAPLFEVSFKGRFRFSMLDLAQADCDLSPEAWLREWLINLCALVGEFQLDAPRSSLQVSPNGPNAEEVFVCRVLLNYAQPSLSDFEALLAWSRRLWECCLSENWSETHAADLRLVPPRKDLREKVSFRAMARALFERRQFFQVSIHPHFKLIRVGTGRRQQLISHKVTALTSAFGLSIAKSKVLTKQLLTEHHLPVARGFQAPTLEAALAQVATLGYPVVTKPVSADQGVGVVTNISDAHAFSLAWQQTAAHGSGVLVEPHVQGRDFRFLLVKGQLLAALERIPGAVLGDGVHTVRVLVDQENQRRRQQPTRVEAGEMIDLVPLRLNGDAEAVLQRQGLTPDAIPAADQLVTLTYGANFGLGGSVRECLAEVHPANRCILEKVATLLQLDVVGIDVIAPSLSDPLPHHGGVICEVNGMPGVLPHLLAEPERSLMAEVAQLLLPTRTTVPLVAVLSPASSEMLAWIEREVLAEQPALVVSAFSGIRQGGELLAPRDGSLFQQHWAALHDPTAAAVLLELDAPELLRHGLIWPQLDLLLLPPVLPPSIPPAWERWLCGCATTVLRLDCLDPADSAWQQARQRAVACLLERG